MNDEFEKKLLDILNNISVDKREQLLVCIKTYKRILQMGNYQEMESVLYLTQDIFSFDKKIEFELERIKDQALKNKIEIDKVLKPINDDIKLLQLQQTEYSKIQKQKNILKSIIELELRLKIDIALYQEFVEYFEELVDDYDDQKKKELI